MSTYNTGAFSALLPSLKVDLGITTTAYDDRLKEYIQAAAKYIEIEGINLDVDEIDDANLVIMYAAWLWRKRENGEGMPRRIRYVLNNRLWLSPKRLPFRSDNTTMR